MEVVNHILEREQQAALRQPSSGSLSLTQWKQERAINAYMAAYEIGGKEAAEEAWRNVYKNEMIC